MVRLFFLSLAFLASCILAMAQPSNPFCGVEQSYTLDYYQNANVSANGNGYDIIRTLNSPISWSNCGGYYSDIEEGEFVSYSAANSGMYNSKPLIVGLATTTGGNYNDIEFGFYTVGDEANVRVFNGSTYIMPVTGISYTSSTLFRIFMDHGWIRFFVNNDLVYSMSASTSTPLYLKFGMYTYDTEIINLLINNKDADCNSVSDIEEEYSVDPCNAIGLDITFEHESDVSETSATTFGTNCLSENYHTWNIIKDGTSGWNAGVSASEKFSNGGYVEYTANEGESAIVGFSRFHSVYNEYALANVDYGIFTDGTNNSIHIMEAGNDVNSSYSFTHNDRLKIIYLGSTIRYYKNATLMHTSSSVFVWGRQMIFDCSIKEDGAGVHEAVFYNCNGCGGRKAVSGEVSESSKSRSSDGRNLQEIIPGAYPNPFETQLYITKSGCLRLFDSFGKLVLVEDEVKAGQPVEVRTVAPGLYYLEITNQEGTQRIKVTRR